LNWTFKNFGFLFRGQLYYENWRNSRSFNHRSAFSQLNLIDIQTVSPASEAKGSIAIHLHIFYRELVDEFVAYLKNIPFHYSLFVSVTNDETLTLCQHAFKNLPFCDNRTIRCVANRGRDLAPMFCTFAEELSKSTYLLHLHGKKSLYNKGATEGWREYLCKNLIGSKDRIRRIFTLLQNEEPYGILYPQNYELLPSWANTWLANQSLGRVWCARLGINDVPMGYFDFPASSMFWARTEALAPLFKAGIRLEDFPEETGQTDGTLAHTLERIFVLCSLKQGRPHGILRNEDDARWSAWGFDRYTTRPLTEMAWEFARPAIQLIGFDIFDTLFCRPLLDPETVKRIVSRRFRGETGRLYQEYRSIAELQARKAKGQDVGLEDIYTYLGKLTRLPDECLEKLRRLEEEVESSSLKPREETVRLFHDALGSGKPVVCITDTFLPRQTIETYLSQHNLFGWKELFVSSEIGCRKDDGKLFDHILNRFELKPKQLLMIGDNERSDIQIPVDMGAATFHLLRPVEFARGLPRFSVIIAHHESKKDIDSELTLGLVIRKNFSALHYPSFDPTSLIQVTPYNWGYSLVGPLLVSFSQWLLQRTRQDNIKRLYFLSREGKIIKEVYDYWSAGESNAPWADYLVLSRRAAGLAAINTFDDILNIAKITYFSNTIENFIQTRYGLHLGDKRWEELNRSLSIKRNSLISVQNKQITHLIPLLKAIEKEIYARVQYERPPLMQYLTEKGLNSHINQAVVDIGFGGSIQGYLNSLLSRKIHGYYLMTDERTAKVAEASQVLLQGCFHENVNRFLNNVPIMYRESFDLEKLLSTNEPQIEYYEFDHTNNIRGCYRQMLSAELVCASIRDQLLEGVMDFTREARGIRSGMLPDFQPSCWTSQMLFDIFLSQKSPIEEELLSKIVLDDYYCGRGLVF
jgi:predicted HAD superfamily hydrolase